MVERIKVSRSNGDFPSQSGDSRIEVWRKCACWNDPKWKQQRERPKQPWSLLGK